MARVALLLITFAALAAWAGAQGPTPTLSAEQRVQLFKSNRTLLENLVENGVTLAAADSSVKRGEAARATATTLGNYLKRAATEDQNPDRVAELAELMLTVLRDGMIPNIDEADRAIPPGAPEAPAIRQLRERSLADIDAIRAAIPAGKVGDNEKVKAAIEALTNLKEKIKK